MGDKVVLNLRELMAWVKDYGTCPYCQQAAFSDKTGDCNNCGAPRAKVEDYGKEVN